MRVCIDCPRLTPTGPRCPDCQVLQTKDGRRRTMARRINTRSIRERNKRILAASTVCHLCSETGADAVDHVIPLAKGGTDDPWNLKPAHHNTPNSQGVKCNREKSDRVPEVRLTTSRTW